MQVDAGAKPAHAFPVAREAELPVAVEDLAMFRGEDAVEDLAECLLFERLAVDEADLAVDPQRRRDPANEVNVAGAELAGALENLVQRA